MVSINGLYEKTAFSIGSALKMYLENIVGVSRTMICKLYNYCASGSILLYFDHSQCMIVDEWMAED